MENASWRKPEACSELYIHWEIAGNKNPSPRWSQIKPGLGPWQ